MYILKMHIGFAYLCIFCANSCIWYFCIYMHFFLHFLAFLYLLCTSIAYFLFAYLWTSEYTCIFCTAYCCLFRAYFCIFKDTYYGIMIFTLMHIQAYDTYLHTKAYLCIFRAYYAHVLHISHMHICAYFLHIRYCIFLHISTYFNFDVMAYLPLCTFKFISAYLHLLCLRRPISVINIQTAAGAQRERCFFRQPNFLSFNRPHTVIRV